MIATTVLASFMMYDMPREANGSARGCVKSDKATGPSRTGPAWPPDQIENKPASAMSIRLIAKELYRLHQEVEKLEKLRARTPLGQIDALDDRLRKIRAERDRIRRALEGSKESK